MAAIVAAAARVVRVENRHGTRARIQQVPEREDDRDQRRFDETTVRGHADDRDRGEQFEGNAAVARDNDVRGDGRGCRRRAGPGIGGQGECSCKGARDGRRREDYQRAARSDSGVALEVSAPDAADADAGAETPAACGTRGTRGTGASPPTACASPYSP